MKKQPKSKRAIIAAFIDIRKHTPVEKMTVTNLCKVAEINKSTFYVYYQDIYDLSDQVENDLVRRITNSISHTECAFDDPGAFTEEVFRAYGENQRLIDIVFSGSRSVMLPKKVHQALTELLFQLRPEYKNSPEKHIMLSYIIYGGYYAYVENESMDRNYRISVISSLTKL